MLRDKGSISIDTISKANREYRRALEVVTLFIGTIWVPAVMFKSVDIETFMTVLSSAITNRVNVNCVKRQSTSEMV